MADLRNTLFSILTGRQADVSGSASGDVRGMLMAVGGTSNRTKSGIDLTKAARCSGCPGARWNGGSRALRPVRGSVPHRSTRRRWRPGARQAATTKAGRKAALAGSPPRQAITSRGARVSIDGLQGHTPRGKDYIRKRVTQVYLDPADAHAMMNAWETGGEKASMSWATTFWDTEYLNDWTLDSVDGVTIERPHGGAWR